MKMKSLILIIIALGCGLVASIGISQVMSKGGGGSAAVETVQILVAKAEISINDKLDANSVQLEEWPAAKIPEGAARSLEEVENKYALGRFYKGEPVLQSKVTDTPGTVNSKIPDGYRSLPVLVDEDTVMEAVSPGDCVDVMVFLRRNEDIRKTAVHTILKNVRVFSKGAQTERVVDAKGQEARARTISLIVKPDQARELALAMEMGHIRLALRPPGKADDDQGEDVTSMSKILDGDAEDGQEPAKSTSGGGSGFLDMVKGALDKMPKNQNVAAAPVVGAPELPKGPSFQMIVLSPNEVKQYHWADPTAMPTETTIMASSAEPPPGATGTGPQAIQGATPTDPANPPVGPEATDPPADTSETADPTNEGAAASNP